MECLKQEIEATLESLVDDESVDFENLKEYLERFLAEEKELVMKNSTSQYF